MEEKSEEDQKNLTKTLQEAPDPFEDFSNPVPNRPPARRPWARRRGARRSWAGPRFTTRQMKNTTNIPENIENKDTSFANEERKQNVVTEDINNDKVKNTNFQSVDMNNSQKLNNTHISTEKLEVTSCKDDHQSHQQHLIKNNLKILNNSLQNYDLNYKENKAENATKNLNISDDYNENKAENATKNLNISDDYNENKAENATKNLNISDDYNENKAENAAKNLNISDDSFTKVLKKMLKILFKIKISCCYCKEVIPNVKDISICPESHFSCKKCVKYYCNICNTECTLSNTKDIFKNLTLACDWKNCNKRVNCLDFIPHKQICCKRDYECPKVNCSFSGSRTELIIHWRTCMRSMLIFDSVLDFSTNSFYNEIYWVMDHLYEMLHIKIVKKDGYVYVEIDETMTISPNNYKLVLFYEYYGNYIKFEDLIQKGKIKTHSYSFHKYTSMRLIMEMKNSVADISDYIECNNVTSEQLMKQLINIFFRISLFCCNCKNFIRDRSEIYICQQSHIACQHCLGKCDSCKSDNVQFLSLNEILIDLEFSCDWKGCKEKANCWDFLKHKQLCTMREYRCPVICQAKNTNFSGSKWELKAHWHDKNRELKFGSHLDFKIENSEKTIYWIADKINELLVVNITYTDGRPYLNVKEEYTVFPNSYIIELYDYSESNKRHSKIQELKQSGGCKKFQSYLYNNTSYRLAIVKYMAI